MSGLSNFEGTGRGSWHALIEQYTPDGTFGRLLLGLASGSVSVGLLILAVWGFASLTFLSLLVALVAAGTGFLTGILAVVTLWPVYLSLIGNVDSPEAYARTRASASGEAGSGPSVEPEGTDADEAIRQLKRQYAAGEIPDEEFEHRLDRLLGADDRVRRSSEGERSGGEPGRELEHS